MDIEMTRQQLREPDPAIRLRAVSELFREVQAADLSPALLGVLREALDDSERSIVEYSLKALAKLGPAASALAQPVFALAERPSAVGKVAVDTLVHLAPGPQLRRLCLQHLERLADKVPSVAETEPTDPRPWDHQWCSFFNALRSGPPSEENPPPEKVADIVTRCLRAPWLKDAQLVHVYAAGLAVLDSLGTVCSAEARREILRLARRSHTGVRTRGEFPIPEVQLAATLTALRVLAHDDELAEIVLHTVRDLLDLPGHARGLAPLLAELPRLEHAGAGARALLDTLVNRDLVHHAVDALLAARVASTEIEVHLERKLEDASPPVRLAAVKGLQRLARTRPLAAHAVERLASDPDKDVRLAVATALSESHGLVPGVRPTLEKLSQDRTKNVREVAKLALTL